LLIAAVSERFEGLYGRYRKSPPPGSTAADRVNRLIDDLTKTMTANRALAAAWWRALLSGKRDVGLHVRGFPRNTQSHPRVGHLARLRRR